VAKTKIEHKKQRFERLYYEKDIRKSHSELKIKLMAQWESDILITASRWI